MPLYNLHLDLANVDTDGLANDLTGAGPWDSDDLVTTETPDGYAHQLNLTSASNLSSITLTLTGTDADDNEITEDVTGPNATTVETTKYFKTLTGVSASATLSTNKLDIGWVDEAVSRTVPLNWRTEGKSHHYLDVTGTISVDVEFTNADHRNRSLYQEQADMPWFNPSSSLDDETADGYVAVEAGLTAFRIKVNSYSSGAEVKLYVSQPDNERNDY